MNLPQEYWMNHTLFEIAYGIGTPLAIDDATQSWGDSVEEVPGTITFPEQEQLPNIHVETKTLILSNRKSKK